MPDRKDHVSKLVFHHVDNACGFHRMLCPTRFLGSEPEFGDRLLGSPALFVDDGDSVVMHGLIEPEGLIAASRVIESGGKFVWSLDDDFTSVPEWNPAKPHSRYTWSWHMALRLSDLIVVSTSHLATKFPDRFRDKVRVAPNLMDVDHYPTAEPVPLKSHASGHLALHVLWSGTETHRKDVEIIEPLVEYFSKNYVGRVYFDFMGGPPPDRIYSRWKGITVRHLPGCNVDDYVPAVTAIRPHVVLAPLDPCEFNRSKSAIRVYDSWALSAVPIASDFGEYSVVKHGVDGFKCKTAEEWIVCLEALVNDPSLRVMMAQNGRRRVEREFNWRMAVCREPWRKWIREVLDMPQPNTIAA